MNKFEKFIINYGLATISLTCYGALGVLLLHLLRTGWLSIIVMIILMAVVSAYSYINGWYKGQWDERDNRNEFLRELDANRISRKNKSKTS